MGLRRELRRANERVQELSAVLRMAERDCNLYNVVIDSLIAGNGSPCIYCEDYPECQLEAKAEGKGCSQWWLAFDLEKNKAAGAKFPEDQENQEEKEAE